MTSYSQKVPRKRREILRLVVQSNSGVLVVGEFDESHPSVVNYLDLHSLVSDVGENRSL